MIPPVINLSQNCSRRSPGRSLVHITIATSFQVAILAGARGRRGLVSADFGERLTAGDGERQESDLG